MIVILKSLSMIVILKSLGMIVILRSLLKCLLKYLLKCVILGKTGAYILGVSLKSVFLSTFSVRRESMSVQSYKYRNAMNVSQVAHDVRT